MNFGIIANTEIWKQTKALQKVATFYLEQI